MNIFKDMKLMYSGIDSRADSLYDKNELELGITEELEHTNDRTIASKIAKDQLDSDPKYYSKLKNKR